MLLFAGTCPFDLSPPVQTPDAKASSGIAGRQGWEADALVGDQGFYRRLYGQAGHVVQVRLSIRQGVNGD